MVIHPSPYYSKQTLLLFILTLLGPLLWAQQGRVLIVSTNRDTVGTHASGTFLREIAYPFQHFIEAGYEVDIVTPNGGQAALYHWGETPAELEKIWKSERFVNKTGNTLAPAQVDTKLYAAVFYPGGHGQYFDVVNDERIARLTAAVYERGGVVATAGHGAASLIDVRLGDGKYLVQGKRMTCFPHWAELAYMSISDYGKLLAFDMEETLKRRGADLMVSTKESRSNREYTHVVDAKNRMVTGAFAESAKWVAEQTVLLVKNNQTK